MAMRPTKGTHWHPIGWVVDLHDVMLCWNAVLARDRVSLLTLHLVALGVLTSLCRHSRSTLESGQ